MSTNMTNKIIGTIAVIALIVGGIAYFKDQANEPMKIGAATGPDNYFPAESHNGITQNFYTQGMKQATGTPCSFQVAQDGFVLTAGINVKTATATALTWTISTSSSPSASTTALMSYLVAANAARALVFIPGATTTAGTAALSLVSQGGLLVHQNEYVNMSAQGSTYADSGTGAQGTCSLKTESI